MPKQNKQQNTVLLATVSLLISASAVFGLMVAGKSRQKKAHKKPAVARQLHKQEKPDPIFEHGFRVGFGMAKTGMLKPKSDELDAMARQAALQMGNDGGLGFKMVWKNGFSMGWMQGD